MSSTQPGSPHSQDDAALEVLRELEQEDAAALSLGAAHEQPLLQRRLRGKQADPTARSITPQPHEAAPPLPLTNNPEEQAIEDEAWAGLRHLEQDCRRQHVHWTHARTTDPNDRQPESFTRAEFWKHMERVYRDIYPEPANKTGSILMFGYQG